MANLLHTLRRTFDEKASPILTKLPYNDASAPKVRDKLKRAEDTQF